MKKTIKFLLVISMFFLGLVALASCQLGGGQQGGGEQPAGCEHVAGQVDADKEYHWYYCDNCGEEMNKEAHSYGEWSVRSEPSVGVEGSKVRTCSVCRYYQLESIPALEVTTGETTEDTVIFAKIPTSWEVAYCYFWGNETEGPNNLGAGLKPSWPGYEMTLVDELEYVWAFVIPAGVYNVIFSNNGSPQTVDLLYVVDYNLYIVSEEANAEGKYTSNCDNYEYFGDVADINKYVQKEVQPVTSTTIYVQLPSDWEGHNVHYWGDRATTWPGNAMDVVDATNNIYSFVLYSDITGFLFDEGDGKRQTSDIKPADNVNGYKVTSDGTVTSCAYENGVFTPVTPEVKPQETTAPVYYVRGSISDWGALETYKFAYDAETDTATITITLAVGDQFKIAEAEWNDATTINALGAQYDAAHFDDVDGGNHNLQAKVDGTFVITITNMSTTTRVCTITLAE